MANSLGDGFVRITYTGVTSVHHQIVPVNLEGTPVAGVEPSFVTKGGTIVTASVGIATYIEEYAKFFPASTNFGLAEVYAVDPDTEERTFLWGYNINLNGSHLSVGIAWEMFTLSFKTIGGGSLKIVGMEASFAVNVYDVPPFVVDTPMSDMAVYVTSEDSIVIGRDNTYAFAPTSFRTKTSDVLRKRQPAV